MFISSDASAPRQEREFWQEATPRDRIGDAPGASTDLFRRNLRKPGRTIGSRIASGRGFDRRGRNRVGGGNRIMSEKPNAAIELEVEVVGPAYAGEWIPLAVRARRP